MGRRKLRNWLSFFSVDESGKDTTDGNQKAGFYFIGTKNNQRGVIVSPSLITCIIFFIGKESLAAVSS